ncbi:hypothetical protein KPH14_009196 [Odynerus spinipes]|uniref:Uncharacterized protein n=1 Tax=Odynerus spinipes TaxID=1348599 RepID=A0AAD9RPX8_9HYME|nr:hypothetical protein KPH14_009196 [Odynerus spinipes]
MQFLSMNKSKLVAVFIKKCSIINTQRDSPKFGGGASGEAAKINVEMHISCEYYKGKHLVHKRIDYIKN